MFHQPFFIPASLMLVFALPLILGIVPPNRLYGIRTAETLADEQRWYQVNQYAGWVLSGSSLLYLSVAMFFPSVIAGETLPGRWLVHLAAFVAPLIMSLVFIRRQVRQ